MVAAAGEGRRFPCSEGKRLCVYLPLSAFGTIIREGGLRRWRCEALARPAQFQRGLWVSGRLWTTMHAQANQMKVEAR